MERLHPLFDLYRIPVLLPLRVPFEQKKFPGRVGQKVLPSRPCPGLYYFP
jgi:hypothetical protein